MNKYKLKIAVLAALLGTTVFLSSCASLGRAIIGGGTTTTTTTASSETETTTSTTKAPTTTTAPTTESVASSETTSSAALTTAASSTTEGSETTAAPLPGDTPLGTTTPHTVTAKLPANWTEVKDVNGLQNFFTDTITSPERYAYAAESDSVYMYVFAITNTPGWDVITELAADYSAELATEGAEATKQNWLDRGYTEGEIANIQAVIDGKTIDSADQATILAENYLRNWIYNLSEDDPSFALEDVDYIQMNGQSAPRAIFDLQTFTQIESDIIVDDQLYIVVAWALQDEFDTVKNEIETVFDSMTFTKK